MKYTTLCDSITKVHHFNHTKYITFEWRTDLMTEMKRITISFPDEIDEAIWGLRKTDEFAGCSYSEIVRKAVRRGLELMNSTNGAAGPEKSA